MGKFVVSCGCKARMLFSDDAADTTQTCRCGKSFTVPGHYELVNLPLGPTDLPHTEMRVVRWPPTISILMVDPLIVLPTIVILYALLSFSSTLILHCDFGRGQFQKIPPARLKDRLAEDAYILAGSCLLAPIAIRRYRLVNRLLDFGILVTGKFAQQGCFGRFFSPTQIDYKIDYEYFHATVWDVNSSRWERPRKEQSIDILVDPQKRSRCIVAPHEKLNRVLDG